MRLGTETLNYLQELDPTHLSKEAKCFLNSREPFIDPHQPGAKLDHKKNRLGLVLLGFKEALNAVGEVGTFGANKYTDNGWKSVQNGIDRYTDAMLRHTFTNEEFDPESNLLHAAHRAWNALAVLELVLAERKEAVK